MAKKDQDKHSKRKEEDKDFGLPEIKITPISSDEVKPEPKVTPVPEKKAEQEKPKEPVEEKKETPAVAPVVSSKEDKIEAKEEKAEPKEEKKEVVPVAATSVGVPKETIEEKEEKGGSKAWLIILLIFLLGIIGYSVYYFTGDGGSQDVESYITEEAEPIVPAEPEKVEEPIVEAVPAAPSTTPETPGLSEVSQKGDSPRYFVTVGAFIDGDLAKDFSDRLNKKGYNTYIIQPGYGSSFYKLAIADFDNVVDATALINEEQANFEETLWVFKY